MQYVPGHVGLEPQEEADDLEEEDDAVFLDVMDPTLEADDAATAVAAALASSSSATPPPPPPEGGGAVDGDLTGAQLSSVDGAGSA